MMWCAIKSARIDETIEPALRKNLGHLGSEDGGGEVHRGAVLLGDGDARDGRNWPPSWCEERCQILFLALRTCEPQVIFARMNMTFPGLGY